MANVAQQTKNNRRRKCARAEGYAWLAFVLLSLFFGIYMTSKAVAEPMPKPLLYEKAVSEGKKASLVEQQRPNLFTQKVANIAPRENIAVTIHYLQRVEYNQGQFSLRFPMTLTPRYMATLDTDFISPFVQNNRHAGTSRVGRSKYLLAA